MSNLDGTIFTKTSDLDTKIFINVYRMTARIVQIQWTDIPFNYFPEITSEAILETSDSPTNGFEELCRITRSSPPFYLDDRTKATYYRFPVLYYRIRFPEINKVTRVFSTEKVPNYYGAEISRRHTIRLKEGHEGNLMYLFIKKKFVEHCPECWDSIRGSRSKSNCPYCLNTGFIGGYYNPIGLYVSVSPEGAVIRQEVDGVAVTGQLNGWTAGFPRINVGDVLVDANTRDIWHVGQVSMTTHKRTVTKQELALSHQDEDTAIFKLLERVPFTPAKGDLRHGEILF